MSGEKEGANSPDRGLGVDKRPLGLRAPSRNRFDIYVSVKLLSTLYAKTALLCINRLGINIELNCSNK